MVVKLVKKINLSHENYGPKIISSFYHFTVGFQLTMSFLYLSVFSVLPSVLCVVCANSMFYTQSAVIVSY